MRKPNCTHAPHRRQGSPHKPATGIYLRLCLSSAFGVVGAYALLVHSTVAYGIVHSVTLERFTEQLQALKDSPQDLNTVFLGDSTLGNAVAPQGPGFLNLALTANYGYAGTYNMLQHALLIRPQVKNFVIVHAIRLPILPVSWLGYYSTLPGEQSWSVQIAGLFYKTMFFLEPGAQRDILGQWLNWAGILQFARADNFQFRDINPRQMQFLEQIAALCKRQHLNCLYALGTIRESICHDFPQYIIRIKAAIAATSIRLIEPTPICIPESDAELGSDDHIAGRLQPQYTQRFLGLVGPYLK